MKWNFLNFWSNKGNKYLLCDKSSVRATLTCCIGRLNPGQPHSVGNLESEANNSCSQTMHKYSPRSRCSLYSPVNGLGIQIIYLVMAQLFQA
ncbi:hypothetical protein DERP_007728 [Dermatophagoides pteronyssinus]|uniref:Uncharacterized protein n=1 Tax=Dermatophagoides pteronyssinus TaxID=6956 RepID=A0ABQ8JKQ1_DERPT|nr:hypothetical protein DERP_007728 [Dermatophagoides pteronyssinus]